MFFAVNYEKGLHEITDPSKPEALKMDGAKLLADIVDTQQCVL